VRDDDDSLEMLLSGGKLSPPQHERILDRVLSEHASPTGARSAAPRTSWRRWGWAGVSALAAAAAFVMITSSVRNQSGWIASKGEASARLVARCLDRPTGTCRRGDKLLFEVEGAHEGGLLAAYADGPAGRVWYFPTSRGELAPVARGPGPIVLAQGARIGAEHPEGAYTLHLLLLAEPAERTALVAGNVRAMAKADVRFEVTP
jgi:hypothetical protein